MRKVGWKSLSRKKVPLVSPAGHPCCLEHAQGLLNWIKSHPCGKIILYSYEKIIVVGPISNPQKITGGSAFMMMMMKKKKKKKI